MELRNSHFWITISHFYDKGIDESLLIILIVVDIFKVLEVGHS